MPGWFKLAVTSAAISSLIPAAALAQSSPVEIRMGVGPSSEEPAWLMKVRPDLTPNQGKKYTYNMTMFRGGNERVLAFEGGQLDAATSSSTGILFAATKGVKMNVVASMGADSAKAFSNQFLALAANDVSVTNLRGKTIGINGYRTSFELYARVAAQKAGLNPDRDVKWTVVQLPQMGEALRAKTIDVGIFPSLFAKNENAKGGVKKVWDAVGVSGIEEEFNIYFSPEFLSKNADAARAWGEDYVAVLKYLAEHPREARQSLLDAKIVQIDPATYLGMKPEEDLYRRADGKPDPDMFSRLQDLMTEFKFIDQKVNIGELVNTKVLP